MINGSNSSPGRSTGNDIVALNGIDKTRTCQPRFYNRIIAVSEQSLYDPQKLAGMRFEQFVWLLWSVKESAYKYVKRSEPGLSFSPTKMIVQQLHPTCGLRDCPAGAGEVFFRGRVISGSRELYFRSTMCEAFIATIVDQQDGFEQSYWGVQRIDDDGYAIQSAAVRELVIRELNALFAGKEPVPGGKRLPGGKLLPGGNPDPGGKPIPGGDLQIVKNSSGCPVIVNGGTELDIPVSLAHHGHYIGYSFVLRRPIFH